MTDRVKRIGELLLDPKLSFQDIAIAVGVSRERVRQIHKAIYPSLPDAKARYAARSEERLAEVAHVPPSGDAAVEYVWAEAQRRGFPVRRYVLDERGSLSALRIWINDTLCAIYCSESETVTHIGQQTYASFRVPRKVAEFGIYLQWIKQANRTFIIPTDVLKRTYQESFYIPLLLDAPPYNNHFANLDWRRYLNAWDQLRW